MSQIDHALERVRGLITSAGLLDGSGYYRKEMAAAMAKLNAERPPANTVYLIYRMLETALKAAFNVTAGHPHCDQMNAIRARVDTTDAVQEAAREVLDIAKGQDQLEKQCPSLKEPGAMVDGDSYRHLLEQAKILAEALQS